MGEITMQKLKEQRMSPAEKFVLDTIKGAKANIPRENGSIAWFKDSKWVFTQSFSNGVLFLVKDISWDLEVVCNLNVGEITQLLNKLLYKYTNNGQLDIIW